MTDNIIPLPDQFDRHLAVGVEAYQDGAYDVAYHHFLDAYNLEDSQVANLWLVKSLAALGHDKDALRLMKEKKSFYQTDIEGQQYYRDTLLSLKHFLSIDLWLAQYQADVDPEWLTTYDTAKSYWLKVEPKEYKEHLAAVQTLPFEKHLQGQSKVLKEAIFLTQEDYYALGQEWLMDTSVTPVVKGEILSTLASLNITDELPVLTSSGMVRRVVPSQLKTLTQVFNASPFLQRFAEHLDNQYPMMKNQLLPIARLHVGILYPFEDDELTPVAEWVMAYELYFGLVEGNEDTSIVEKTLQIEQWQQQIWSTMRVE